MAAEFVAGSIVAALKAQIEEFEKGIQKAKTIMTKFGTDVGAAAKTVETGGQKISDTFTAMDRNALKTTEKIAKFTQRLVSLQFAMASLGSAFGGTSQGVKAGTDAVTAGLSVFAAAVTLFPNHIGLAVGAVGGLSASLLTLANNSKATAEKVAEDLSKMTLSVVELGRSLDNFAGAPKKAKEASNALADIFRATAGERAQQDLENTKSRVQELLKFLQDAPRTLAEASNRVTNAAINRPELESGFQLELDLVKQGVADAVAEVQGLGLNLRTALQSGEFKELDKVLQQLGLNLEKSLDLDNTGTKFIDAQTSAKIAAFRVEVDLLGKGLAELRDLGTSFQDNKLATPLESAEKAAKAAEENLKRVLQVQQELERLLKTVGLGEDAKKALKDFQKQISESTLGTSKSDLGGAKLQLQIAQRPAEFAQTFAEPFSKAIGSGIAEGILAGKSAMETLAGVGANLFNNFLQQSVQQFQTLMTQALTAIAGSGGAILGSLFSGIAGIVGLLASRRSGVSGQEFSQLAPSISSSQLVRGVVAGPQSVAIASLGDNLRRALVGVEARLDVVISVLTQIRNSTAGAAAGGSGFPLAGTVPTT